MDIEPSGKHYSYIIKKFVESEFPIDYDRKRFPKGFDTINIDCYGDGSLRQMFLSKENDWVAVDSPYDVEKIVQMIEEHAKKKNCEEIIRMISN